MEALAGNMVAMFALAAVAGLGVGVLSGLLGIGGGTVMVPLFRLVFGMEPIAATATSLFTIIPTSLSGLAKHARNKTSVPKVGVITGLAGAVCSPLGVLAAAHSPNWAIMLATAIIVAYSASTMIRKGLAMPKAGKAAPAASEDVAQAIATAGSESAADGAAASSKPAADTAPGQPNLVYTASLIAKILVIGAVAGLLGGYCGVGGGFIMVPMFIAVLGIPMRLASGTSLTAVCILAIPGVIEQALLGNVNFTVGIAMAAGSIPGALLGAGLVKRVPERTLRLLFGVFLVFVAIFMVANELL